jgi:hypothetical protein
MGDNIKMNLRGAECENGKRNDLAPIGKEGFMNLQSL